jgi:hypothetical protein
LIRQVGNVFTGLSKRVLSSTEMIFSVHLLARYQRTMSSPVIPLINGARVQWVRPNLYSCWELKTTEGEDPWKLIVDDKERDYVNSRCPPPDLAIPFHHKSFLHTEISPSEAEVRKTIIRLLDPNCWAAYAISRERKQLKVIWFDRCSGSANNVFTAAHLIINPDPMLEQLKNGYTVVLILGGLTSPEVYIDWYDPQFFINIVRHRSTPSVGLDILILALF